MGKHTLVLASTSRHRRALLERAGLGAVRCVAPRCDEVVDEFGLAPSPVELVELLARRKAESVAGDFPSPDTLIIGADQVVELDGEVLGKPGTASRALTQLEAFAGREHRLITGICIHSPSTGRSEVAHDIHRMKMWPLDRERLERYIEMDRPLDCAGSYRVESMGALLFESMAGDDFTAIVGLPLSKVGALLGRFDAELLDFALSP